VAYGQIKRELAAAESTTLAAALEVEAQAQDVCGETADHRNATAAFVAKQRPVFEGR
jgi:2-(1,2-epoxy-1,2-dihydrophenyl)acetyl-CoA isomerase